MSFGQFSQRRIIAQPTDGTLGYSTTTCGTTPTTSNAGVMLYFAPTRPSRVVRWGYIVGSVMQDNASATFTMKCNLWPELVTSTNAVTGLTTAVSTQTGYNSSSLPAYYTDLAGGTITVSNATLTNGTGIVAGSMLYHNVFPQTGNSSLLGGLSTYYPAPEQTVSSVGAYTLVPPGGVSTQFVVWPGQAVVLVCTAVGATPGAAKFWLEIEEQAFVAPNNNNPNVTTGVPSAIRPTPSDPEGGYTTSSTAFSTTANIVLYNS